MDTSEAAMIMKKATRVASTNVKGDIIAFTKEDHRLCFLNTHFPFSFFVFMRF